MSQPNGHLFDHDGRYDLSFLFCMVGRHAPAMAILVILLLSMFVFFIIYQKVSRRLREKVALQPHQKEATAVDSTGSLKVTKIGIKAPRIFYGAVDRPEKRAPTHTLKTNALYQEQQNEDDPIEDSVCKENNTVEAIDVVERRAESSDDGGAASSVRAADTPPLYGGHQPQTVNDTEEDVSVELSARSDNSCPGPGFEHSTVSFMDASGQPSTHSLTSTYVSPGPPKEELDQAVSHVSSDLKSVHQPLNTTGPQNQLTDVCEAVLYETEDHGGDTPDQFALLNQQQPLVGQEIQITTDTEVLEEPDEETTVQDSTSLAERNLKQVCSDPVESRAEVTVEGRKTTEMRATTENDARTTDETEDVGGNAVAHSAPLNEQPQALYQEQQNEDDPIEDAGGTASSVRAADTPPLYGGHQPQPVNDTEEDVSVELSARSDNSWPGPGFEHSTVSFMDASGQPSTHSLTSTYVSPGPPKEELDQAGSHVSSGLKSVHQPLNTTGPQNQPADICEAVLYETEDHGGDTLDQSALLNQQQPLVGQEIQFTTDTEVLEEPDEETTVQDSTSLAERNLKEVCSDPVESRAEVTVEGPEKTETDTMEEQNEHIADGNYQQFSAQRPNHPEQPPVVEASRGSKISASTPPPEEVTQNPRPVEDKDSDNVLQVDAWVAVSFGVRYFTDSPGQMLAVTGNLPELGSWTGFVPLKKAEEGYWTKVISLPSMSRIQWKFVLLDEGEVRRWEECDDRFLDTGCSDYLHMHKRWGVQ